MHSKQVIRAGVELGKSSNVLILLHGRGGTAEDILSLARYLPVKEFTLVAPQATNNTWYPYSFLAPRLENEPWLSSALSILKDVVHDLEQNQIERKNIYFLGFSQGACLATEFFTQHGERWGGLIAFTGGLIGEQIDKSYYRGDFDGTPVFISTGDQDPHVPLRRVQDSVALLKEMNADVKLEIYSGRPHTITREELDEAAQFVFSAEQS